MGQSKMLLTIDKSASNIARNSVYDCHLSPIAKLFLSMFDLRALIVIKFSIAAYLVCKNYFPFPSDFVWGGGGGGEAYQG